MPWVPADRPTAGRVAGLTLSTLLLAGCGGQSPPASLTGTVTDGAGLPLAGAAVVIGDGATRMGAVTGSLGTYHFNRVPVGHVAVHIFAAGRLYDPGHHLRRLESGNNTYDVRLDPQPAEAGPRFRGNPTIRALGKKLHLAIQVDPGPGSPVGSELLAVDSEDAIAVLLHRSSSGLASADVPRSSVREGAEWRFVATDDACQETPAFPSARVSD